jgi:pimeloyl-ACP methyl ester carboxylesterase
MASKTSPDAPQSPSPDPTKHTVSTRAGPVSYRDEGSGVPIVLLHAILHTSHDYDSIIPGLLSAHHRIIAPDWPWHGTSPGLPPPAFPTAVLFADILEDIVTALALPPAIFIGNSVGGFAACRLAITHPSQVRGLILVNTGGFPHINFFSRTFCRALGVPLIARWVLPVFVRQYMSAQTPADEVIAKEVAARARDVAGSTVAAAMWKSFLEPGHDLRKRAGEIKAPTLIVWGALDPVVPVGVGRATHQSIAGSRLEELETGHVVFSSKPEEFLGLVEPFIEAVLAEGGGGPVSSDAE